MIQKELKIDGIQTFVTQWAEPADFARDADSKLSNSQKRCREEWTGETWKGALANAIHGSKKHVPAAEAMLEKASFAIESPRSRWVSSVAGAYPIVPEALAGFPEPMRRRVNVKDEGLPLKIVIDCTSSAAIDHKMLLTRGITYLALAMNLANTRPVEMHMLIAEGDTYTPTGIVAIRIPSAPLDLAVASNALTSVGLMRGLGYSWLNGMHGVGGGWAWCQSPFTEAKRKIYIANMRVALELAETDLFVPPTHCDDEAIKNPIEFLKWTVSELNGESD